MPDGRNVIASLPKLGGEYDLRKLSEYALELKRSDPDRTDASVLLEPDIEYDHLIQVMDAMRSTELASVGDADPARMTLFTDISIGDAP